MYMAILSMINSYKKRVKVSLKKDENYFNLAVIF